MAMRGVMAMVMAMRGVMARVMAMRGVMARVMAMRGVMARVMLIKEKTKQQLKTTWAQLYWAQFLDRCLHTP